MLKTPGLYLVHLIVHADGKREVVIQNPGQPFKLEDMGR